MRVLKSELLEFNHYVSIGDSTDGGYEHVVSSYQLECEHVVRTVFDLSCLTVQFEVIF